MTEDVFVSFPSRVTLPQIRKALDEACIAMVNGQWKNIRLGKDEQGNSALVGFKVKKKAKNAKS